MLELGTLKTLLDIAKTGRDLLSGRKKMKPPTLVRHGSALKDAVNRRLS